jgi:Ser/Thr protein kinase RdoA (MazF antagonist)
MKPTRDRLRQFVKKRLLQVLDHPQSEFFIEKTNLGIHNQVYYLDIEGMPPLVLKGIKKRGRFSELIRCAEHLAEKGINVPKIIYAHEDRKLFKRIGLHIICEERIIGETLHEKKKSDELIAHIARFLSRMHSHKRGMWGKIDEGRNDSLYGYLFSKINVRLKKWEKFDALFSIKLKENIINRLKPRETEIDNIKTFSLSHCDLNPGNIIVKNDNQIFLLDTGHAGYLPPAIDFYTLQVQLCEDNEEKIKVFENAWFEGMAREDIEDFKASEEFFKVYVLVNFGSMLAERIKRGFPKDPFHEQLPGYLNKVKKMIE